MLLIFQCTDKHMGNREGIITQTSVPEPASEDNSLGYKGKAMLVLSEIAEVNSIQLSFLWTKFEGMEYNSNTDVIIYRV